MVTTSDIKKGLVVKIDGNIYTVIDFLHVKPGKGGAFVRTKLKAVTKGGVLDRTFRSGEKLEDVRIERNKMSYLYDEGDDLVFMDSETYEQVSVSKEMAGDLLNYIKENDVCEVMMYEEAPIAIEPPTFVNLEVTYAEPGVRGDTATNVTKTVQVSTGAEFQVPIFVEQGDVIKIDTRTAEYVERVKKYADS
jgi:elongation factor P